MTMHERYAGIPPAMKCSCCGAAQDNETILRATDRIHAAMLEIQRHQCGYYKRRPTPSSKPNGIISQFYQPVYGRYTDEQRPGRRA